MEEKIPTRQYDLHNLRRARWLVFAAAVVLVGLAQSYNYWVLELPLSDVLINLFIGLLVAWLMTEFGLRYFSGLQRNFRQAITSLDAAEAQLHWQSAALASVANAIVITDSNGRITWINPAFTQLYRTRS